MTKTILITGSTDGIGLAAAQRLAKQGHTLLLHGRNPNKAAAAEKLVKAIDGAGLVTSYIADLSKADDVEGLAAEITENQAQLDVLINNAGVYKTSNPMTSYGIDVRLFVNTLAPYILTKRLLSLMNPEGRVLNLSSAAQAPVDLHALEGKVELDDMSAYAQSKLAIVMWSQALAKTLPDGPVIVSVNPGSLLASKMVKEGFGVAGKDIGIGAEILERLALSPQYADVSGQYFDNDSGQFAPPHPAGLDEHLSQQLVQTIERVWEQLRNS